MKKLILLFVILSAFSINSYSQLVTFDSLRVVLSSSQYDYKNPKFYYNSSNAFSVLVYEKWNSTNSNIALRRVYYDSIGTEIMLTNNPTGQNINPSMSDNIITWQSNISGNWDIYYSLNTSGIWSAPVVIANTAQNETNPVIYSNRTAPIQYSFYYLAYIKNNDVYFKSYRVNPATWYPDTNITSNISYNCLNPAIGMGSMGGTRNIYFSMALSDTLKRIYTKTFTENYTVGIVSWNAGNEMYKPKSQENLRISDGRFFYEYDTLGGTHSIGINGDVFTFPVSGKNSNSDGNSFGIITNNLTWWSFTAFGCINKRNDSTSLKVIKNLYYNSPPNEMFWKNYYLGNAAVNSNVTASSPIIKNNYFKLILVCEKLLNGKTALYATYLTDLASQINNENESISFGLYQNYPNPFNPSTVVRFSLSVVSNVVLKVYDVSGREVETLVNEQLQPGTYSTQWNASAYSSGVYFYKLSTEGFTETKRMLMIK